MKIRNAVFAVCIIGLVLLGGCAAVGQSIGSLGDRFSSASSSADEQRAQKEASLPTCSTVIGTVAIVEPEHNWWQAYQLESPEALIKMYVQKSHCFRLVDRGRGFDIAEHERALAKGGNLKRGSHIGGRQIKAADYVITPDIVASNNNSGGSGFGAILGSFIPIPGVALVASNLNLSDKSAEVTLAVTDVRTSEQVILADGKASKTDLGFGFAGGALTTGGFGAAGLSSYANTGLGKVVAMAYLNAYTKMVSQISALRETRK